MCEGGWEAENEDTLMMMMMMIKRGKEGTYMSADGSQKRGCLLLLLGLVLVPVLARAE